MACPARATWGGLRGAISIALALSLAPGPERDPLLAALVGKLAPLVESFRLDEARRVLLSAAGSAGEEGDAP